MISQKDHVKLKLFKTLSVVFILLLFSLLNIQRNFDWKDGYTLWKDSAVKTPNYAKPHINLGSEYNQKGLNKLAVEEFKKAIELLPDHAESHYNLGKVYSDLRDYKNAAIEFLLAIQYDKDNYKAMFALGNTYSKTGQYAKAINFFNKADQTYKRIQNELYLDAIHNLGEVYGKMGKLGEAIKQFKKVLEIDPDHTLAKENLVRAHKYLKDINDTH
jgi:tetratricopeptide (TPR) repeat protein